MRRSGSLAWPGCWPSGGCPRGAGAGPPADAGGRASRSVAFRAFGRLQACHNNLTSPEGEDVSIGVGWRATMMANSARDPYWQAPYGARRSTTRRTPPTSRTSAPAATCRWRRRSPAPTAAAARCSRTCRSGRQRHRDAAPGRRRRVLHRLPPDLRRRARHARELQRPVRRYASAGRGVRRIFGPFDVDAGPQTIMRSVTGYEQVQAPHIRESELCASCHTLITKALGADGEVIGSLPEQMNYQEWQHSAFAAERKSCQSCHMPRVPARCGSRRCWASAATAVAARLRRRQRPHAAHAQPLPRRAGRHGAASGTRSDGRRHHPATAAGHRDAVDGGAQTARRPSDVRRRGPQPDRPQVSDRISRHAAPGCMWSCTDGRRDAALRVRRRARDGSIEGNDNDADARTFEPHYDADHARRPGADLRTDARRPQRDADDRSADGHAILEGQPAAAARLRQGHGAAGDRRLWRGSRAIANFTGAGDRVHYESTCRRPGLHRRGRAAYQSIGYRWAQNLRRYDAPEPRRFASYYRETASGSSVVVARAAARSAP